MAKPSMQTASPHTLYVIAPTRKFQYSEAARQVFTPSKASKTIIACVLRCRCHLPFPLSVSE